jgi:hypothetical protein
VNTSYISAELRRLLVARAESLCEYCLIHEEDTFFGCEVDRIISRKHGGATDEQNLALAYLFCNRNKGSDLASLAPGTDRLVRFFDPRSDHWSEHFRLESDGITLVALTENGEATARIFGFNEGERLFERDTLALSHSSGVAAYPRNRWWQTATVDQKATDDSMIRNCASGTARTIAALHEPPFRAKRYGVRGRQPRF